jgi:hypothetical protein
MSILIPYRRGGINARTRSALAQLEDSRQLDLAAIQHQAELQTARLQAVAYVGRRGMEAVAMVSELEGRLGQLCPLAVSRLQAIADVTTLGIAEVVADTVRRVQ